MSGSAKKIIIMFVFLFDLIKVSYKHAMYQHNYGTMSILKGFNLLVNPSSTFEVN